MTAWAQEYLQEGLKEAQAPSNPAGFSLISSLMSAAGALLLVLALIYAVFFILRAWGVRRGWVLPPTGSALRVLGSHSLDGRKTLYLVQVGTSVLLLGAGSSEVSLLHSIEDPKEVEKVAMIIRAYGNSTTETMMATPWKEFLAML